MTTLVVVMAHNVHLVHHFMQQWEKHGHDILIVAPQDSIPAVGHPILALGTAQHHGPIANRRFKDMLRFLSLLEYDRFAIFEYDSMCLGAGIPVFTLGGWETCMAGNLFRDDRPERGFEGTTFIHPPLIIPRCYTKVIAAKLKMYSDTIELGFWDRMLGLAIEELNLPFVNFLKFNLGFARNTIEQHELGDAIAAVEKGALFVHGIKRWTTFEALRDAYNRSEKRFGLEIQL